MGYPKGHDPNREKVEQEDDIQNIASCMLSILDSVKLSDTNSLDLTEETLSEVMFRKMKAYNIDLNEILGFDHLKPITVEERDSRK